MSPSPVSVFRLVLCGVAPMAAIACGRSDDAQTDVSTTVTSAKIEVSTPDTETAKETLCLAPADDEPPAVGSGTVLIPTILLTAVPPAKRVRAHAAQTAQNGAATPAAGRNGANALNGAIAAELTAEARRNITPGAEPNAAIDDSTPPATGGQVTTTSATVPRGPAEPSFAPARIAFDSHLPGDYELERLRFVTDGSVAYDARVPGSIELAPGAHVVEVIADYRLNDPLFTYVRDYRVELRSTEVIPATRMPTAFVATVRPTGGVTTPMDKRAALAWRSFPAR